MKEKAFKSFGARKQRPRISILTYHKYYMFCMLASDMHTIKFSTTKKFEVVDITEEVVKKFVKSGGWCLVYTPHATAAIVVNESWDPNIGNDLLKALDKIVPLHGYLEDRSQGRVDKGGLAPYGWKHDRIDGNAAAHIKAAILGPSELIPIREGKLALGRWQNIFFVELDGPRSERVVYVDIIH